MSIDKGKKFDSNQDMLQYFDIKYMLGDSELVTMDRMSMANGVEIRSPFLDYRLVELAMKIPYSSKAKTFNTYGGKKILKDSFNSDILTKNIKNRKKTGWFSPVHYWTKDYLWDDITTSIRKLPETGLFNDSVVKYIDKYDNKNTQKIWNLFIFSIWYDIYIGYK